MAPSPLLDQSPDFFSKQFQFQIQNKQMCLFRVKICLVNRQLSVILMTSCFVVPTKCFKTVRTTSAAGYCNLYMELSVASTVQYVSCIHNRHSL